MDEWVTLGAGEVYTYTRGQRFCQVGSGYFVEPMYQGTDEGWHAVPGGNRVTYTVSQGGRLQVVQPLALSNVNPYATQVITATFRIKNVGDRPITIQRLLAGGRGPDCSDWSCPRNADFPTIEWITLQPGEERPYERGRAFCQAGSGYFAQPVYQDA